MIPLTPITSKITDEYGQTWQTAVVYLNEIKSGDDIVLKANAERTMLVLEREVGDIRYTADYYYDATKKSQGFLTRQLKVNIMEDGKITGQTGELVVDMANPEITRILEAGGGDLASKLQEVVKADLRYRFK